MLRRSLPRLAGLDKVMSMESALADIPNGASIAFGGFASVGIL